jgi:hypothetical protein
MGRKGHGLPVLTCIEKPLPRGQVEWIRLAGATQWVIKAATTAAETSPTS